MEECVICMVSGTKEQLLDGITGEGIVKVCRRCSAEESIPLIKKPSGLALEESEKRQTVYERLSRASGITQKKSVNKVLQEQETSLREIVDRNFESSVHDIKEKEKRDDLIDNFHWVLMRARRLKKLTPEQLGDKIGESGMAIKMAEKGKVPRGYEFIRKLENYLNVKLIKDIYRPKEKPQVQVVDSELLGKPEEIFEEETSRALTISDLQEMKKKKERVVFNENVSEGEPEFIGRDEIEVVQESPPTARREEAKKEDLSDESFAPPKGKVEKKKRGEGDISKEEIDRILFGK